MKVGAIQGPNIKSYGHDNVDKYVTICCLLKLQ